jgi:hypothetical protein
MKGEENYIYYFTKGAGQTQGSAPTINDLRFTINKNNRVIANKVKQSYKSRIRLLRLPVHYTQTGRFSPRNDNNEFSETGTYIYIDPLKVNLYN